MVAALGWVGLPRRIPFVRRTPAAAPGPVVTGCSSDTDGDGPRHRWFLGAVAGAGTNRTIIETRPSIPSWPAWVVSAPSYLVRRTAIQIGTPPRPSYTVCRPTSSGSPLQAGLSPCALALRSGRWHALRLARRGRCTAVAAFGVLGFSASRQRACASPRWSWAAIGCRPRGELGVDRAQGRRPQGLVVPACCRVD